MYPGETPFLMTRDMPLNDPALQQARIVGTTSRATRRKYSIAQLEEGARLTKELGSIAKAARVTGVNYYILRDWVRRERRAKDRQKYEQERARRKTKHSIALLRDLVKRAELMQKQRGISFKKACIEVCRYNDVSAQYLYHIKQSGRVPV